MYSKWNFVPNLNKCNIFTFSRHYVSKCEVVTDSYAVTSSEVATCEKTALIEHTFRWGIGNKFRSQSKNRFRPTHAQRPTTASVRADYFTPPQFKHCKILYDQVNEQWEVQWLQYGKLNGKPFPIKKFGIEASKRQALDFAKNLLTESPSPLEDSLSASVFQENLSNDGSSRLKFDHKLHCWVAIGRLGKRPVARAFSADFHGEERAKQLALDFANQ